MLGLQQGPETTEDSHGEPGQLRVYCRGQRLDLVIALASVRVNGGDGIQLCEAELGRVEAVVLVDFGDLVVAGLGKFNVDALVTD